MSRRRLLLRGAVLLAALLALALGMRLLDRLRGPPDLTRWRGAIRAAAGSVAVDPALLSAMVAVESGGRPDAESPKGARGLLQLMPATAAEEAARQGIVLTEDEGLLEPGTNLRLGAGYLRRLLDRYDGDETLALAAYNAGPTNLARWRARGPDLSSAELIRREAFPETRAYVARVLRWREAYR